MKNTALPPVVRVYYKTRQEFLNISRIFEACLVGFWLGILDNNSLQVIDDDYYKNSTKYLGESHNRGGLFSWEEEAIQAYFLGRKKLLLIGAGGGRETLALGTLGFEVEAFECNLDLLDYARKLLEEEKILATVDFCPRDHCPSGDRRYDGSIVGYGVYSYVRGRKRRVAFLKELHARVQTDAPVLLSFSRRLHSIRYRLIYLIANIFRWLFRKEPIELGDELDPYFLHFFTEDEIKSELREGGFELIFYSEQVFTHVVGIAK